MRRMPLAAIVLASLGQVVCAQSADDAVARFKSCLQLDGAARGECLEKLSQELSAASAPAPAPAPAPAQPSGADWVISETTSPIDYSPQITAAISLESAEKDAPSSFAIRCRGARIELLVGTTGSWRPSNNGEFKVAYRIDDEPTIEAQWTALAGGRGAMFKGDITRLLRTLREEGRLSIRVYDWQGSAHETTFQIPKVDLVRQKVAAVCKW